MKKQGLLNPHILSAIAGIGHTEYLVIADAGLPVLSGIPVIDISLIRGVPGFGVVLDAVAGEMVVESYVVAEEIMDKNPDAYKTVKDILPQVSCSSVDHETFKAMVSRAKVVVRTGETTPYANVILAAGVNF